MKNTDNIGLLLNPYAGGGDFDSVKQRPDYKANWAQKFIQDVVGPMYYPNPVNVHGDYSRFYFGRPTEKDTFYKSKFRPTRSSDVEAVYYGVKDPLFLNDLVHLYNTSINSRSFFPVKPLLRPGDSRILDGYYARSQSHKDSAYIGDAIERHLPWGDNPIDGISVSKYPLTDSVGALGNFTVSRGKDDTGDYLSYYDKWDLNGFTDITKNVEKYGVGRPYEIYDRIYGSFDDDGTFHPLGEIPASVVTPDSYASGGKIHIKPSKRGTFTAAAKKHGKSVQAFASQVLAHKENYSPAMVKKANFARNAAKWHAEGGSLDNTIDYTGINTTNHRKYNPDYISYIDTSLANADISPAKRASILANIIEESGGNPFALDDTGKFYGLLQWADDRYKVTGEKDPYKEIDNQVNHILNTLGNTTDKVSWTHGGTGSGYNSYKDAMTDFDSDDLATAMKGFTLGYVRPTGKMDSYNNRLKVAEQLLQRYNNTPLQKVTNLAERINKVYGGDMSAILKLIGSASGGIR